MAITENAVDDPSPQMQEVVVVLFHGPRCRETVKLEDLVGCAETAHRQVRSGRQQRSNPPYLSNSMLWQVQRASMPRAS